MAGKKKVDSELFARMVQDAGKGFENVTIVDRAFWLDDDELRDEPWLVALETLDGKGKKEKLVELLRSDTVELRTPVRWYLADLLERYDLKKRPGRTRTPAYERSPAEATLHSAVEEVKYLVREECKTVRKAIDVAAAQYGIQSCTLADAYEGRRGATQRLKKRLKKHTRPKRS